jgi:hypothetical protein
MVMPTLLWIFGMLRFLRFGFIVSGESEEEGSRIKPGCPSVYLTLYCFVVLLLRRHVNLE